MSCPFHKVKLVAVGVYKVQCPCCDHTIYTSTRTKSFKSVELPFWCKGN